MSRKWKLLILGALGAMVLLLWASGIQCGWKQLFSLPCPGCGMTRAWLAALRFDWKAAFSYHPLFWSVPLLLAYFWTDGKLLGRPRLDGAILILLLGGFGVLWLLRLFVPAWRIIL